MTTLSLPNPTRDTSLWPKQGIHLDIPAEQYHGLHGLSKSWMDKIRQTPAHLADYIQNGPQEPTDAMKMGSAVHCCALEPERFDREYVIGPDTSGVTKQYKAFKKAAEDKGLTVLSVRDGRWCRAISDRVRSHPVIRSVFKDLHWVEPSLVWDREKFVCKARPDLVVPEQRLLIDLKTTLNGSKIGFAREIARYHYHTQGAWYMDAMSLLTGEPWDTFWFVAAEKKRPFLVSVHEIERGDVSYELGKAEYEKAFETYRDCTISGNWPGYEDELFKVELPEWATESYEEPFE